MFQSRESRIEAEHQIDFAEWIDPELADEWLGFDQEPDLSGIALGCFGAVAVLSPVAVAFIWILWGAR